jgi:hypothetical protein
VAPRIGVTLVLLVAVGGCGGSTGQVNVDGEGNGNLSFVGNHPPIEGEIREGELRGVTPPPAPITPIAAMETPVPTPTPRPK